MISQAAVDQHLLIVWLLLAAASAGVFLHAGIKFPWFVFFQKDSGLRPPDPPSNMRVAMVLFSALCIGLGVYPEPLYALLPYPVEYVPYTGAHVVTQLQLLLFSGLAFFVLLDFLRRTLTITLDTDWFYRRLGRNASLGFLRGLARLGASARTPATRIASVALRRLERHHGPDSTLARTWPTGSMALWVMILLLAYLLAYYV
jgi:multicomponent Na+:H+ antiporter subunit D